MKKLKNIGTPISRAQQKLVRGGAKIPVIGIQDDCLFPPLAPPPPGCNWNLDMVNCTAELICSGPISIEF